MQTTERDIAGSVKALPPGALEILSMINKNGGMLCTGSCHHQKKEHLHCRQIGKVLEMGFSTVWDRIKYLISEGFVEREKVKDGPVNFKTTGKGEDILHKAGMGI
ncbi:MAG: hypothetical protein K6U74_21270 [Firmicutes bacterium]|nr:hypothetical protein [Bacillota bacterium]